MNAQMWRRGLVASVVAATVAAGSPAAADETTRLTGEDAAHAALGGGDTAASYGVALPDLAIAHRLPSGAMNLWRMPLSQLEDGFGTPQLVKNLDYGGFSYDRSVTVAGDFADITPADDGTADHIIWHAQPDGGVLLWAVGGGGDTTPRLWQDLRTGGWSYANSRPMLGDVNADGWDDLVVQHRNYGSVANIWVFLSDGQQLGAPQLWSTTARWGADFRYLLADVSGDGAADLVMTTMATTGIGPSLTYTAALSNTVSGFNGSFPLFQGHNSAGWSFVNSRQVAGDVTGDGFVDLLTIHAQPNGGVLVWLHQGYLDAGTGQPRTSPPVVWQDLRTGGWSFAGSRQYTADTNGDFIDDLVTVHRQAGNPGELIWRHVSTGTGLLAPQVIADLRSGGWNYSASREGVAHTWGMFA
jgi:hypothetical protein